MSRKKKIIIIVLLVLLILLLLLGWFMLTRKASPGDANIPPDLTGTSDGLGTSGDVTTAPQERPSVPEQIAPPEETAPQEPTDSRTGVRRLAMAFAERFGSFSNQGDYQNMKDLHVFMSVSMKTWADRYVATATAAPSDEYYGVTTRALSNTLDAFSEEQGEATVTVATQRTERTGLAQTQAVRYQSIRIEFVMENDAWKVDGAFWIEGDDTAS